MSDFTPALASQALALEVLAALAVPAWLHRGSQMLFANPAFTRLSKHALPELMALPLLKLVSPQDRAALARATTACLRGDAQPPACALQLVTADGTPRPVELTLRRVPWGSEQEAAVLVTCLDLSDIQHVQSSLQAMSELLRQIVDGAPVATFVIDRNHRVTHWNSACERLTGVAMREIVGSTEAWRAFYASRRPLLPDLIVDGVEAAQLLRQADGQAQPSALFPGGYESESFFPGFGPQGRWLYFTAVPLRDGDGQILGAIETLQDVTEHRLAERELTRHRNELEALVAQRSAALADSVRELERRFSELQETNRKLEQAQNQLLQSDKMASIGQLAAGVAHEINNPVAFVSSNLHSLRQYVLQLLALVDAQSRVARAPEDDQARSDLQAALAASELDYLREDLPQLLDESAEGLARVKKIVQDLKDFSRVDQSDWQEADLNAGIESTLNVVRHEVKYKAEVVLRLAPLPPVRCLAGQLNQVFLNLIVNASHAIEGHGLITLSSGVQGDWVWVQVDDTGCGMSEEVRRRIFEPFYSTKDVGKGTGLGLSLSFSIMQRHGGEIAVRSVPGQGSSFRVWVPTGGPAPAGTPAATVPSWD